ncbi:unnamed protein product [Phaedon cochleariae]|uniref:Clip domain-containing protein n=1 Tax=Phaedon cochleariae TaxID=80249 RepID=A0A9P0GNE2_PHACE|nr:unnamed protein product [Phaedon cochleariae]
MVCGEVMKYIVIILVISNNMMIGDSQETCDCIRLKECSTFIILIKTLEEPIKSTFIDYLRTKQCDHQGDHPKVCCPPQMKKDPNIFMSSSNIMTTPTTPRSLPSTTKISKTQPCHGKSKCIVLKDCTPYMALVKSTGSPLTRNVVRFLRSQECGFQDGMPKVCCAALPTKFQALKHARPGSRRPFKKLSAVDGEATTATTRRGTRSTPRHFRQEFGSFRDEVMSSDFFDYMSSFDLVLRKKRFDNDNDSDIEIR